MPIKLTANFCNSVPVDVCHVSPDSMAGKSVGQVAKTHVQYGNEWVEIGELFEVHGSGGDDQIVWRGDLRHVHRIGCRLKRGQIMIEGSAGNHVGAQMTGGEIDIEGDAGDFAGAQMQGGRISIRGSAGDFVGGCYPGSKTGINRGAILIDGDAGAGTGTAMRRGMIAIGGNAGPGLGTNMLAGTIVVLGDCNPAMGWNMKRGTIVIVGPTDRSRVDPSDVNFRYAGCLRPSIIPMIANWLAQNDFSGEQPEWGRQMFSQYAGDYLRGGRGELFIRLR